MSAQEPFTQESSAENPAGAVPSLTTSPQASERFTVDYNPDPDFAALAEPPSEEMAVTPPHGSIKLPVSSLIAIAATVITLIGLGLDSFWLISFGSLITLIISLRLAMPTLRAVVNDLSSEQRSLIIAIPGLMLGIYGLMHVSGVNAGLLRWGATLRWDAIGALGDFLGAIGQIFIAILALYVAWRQFIISRDLTTQQNLITQQQTIDAYFQGISELVLDDEGLLEDWPQERIIAEARTAAILGSIDGEGKAKVLRFLSRSKLLTPLARDQRLGRPILDGSGGYAEDRLNGTRVIDLGVMLAAGDLSGNDLRWADLSDINLIRSDLSQCDMVRADLARTVLCDANLSGADLMGTRFFYGTPEAATPRTRTDKPNYETGEFTGAVIEGMDVSNVQRLSESQRCYLCQWGGSKTRATVPGGCRDIPNRLGR
ncbi:MAG: pentapeptide repeat-containing protein [Cyanobacteria bacterium P01_D01_bin.156]